MEQDIVKSNPNIAALVCDFCYEIVEVDFVYFLENRADKKVVICDKCELKYDIVTNS